MTDQEENQMYTQPPKKKHRGRNVVIGLVGAISAIIVVSAAVGGSKTDGAATSSPSTAVASVSATDNSYTSIPVEPLPTTAQATVAAQVVFACTGQAPDGIDITYGPEGSDYSASDLPFSKTMPLDETAQYYAINAQLSGSGHVTCTTTVQASDGTQAVKTATAEGGYSIATAEVCGDFSGGWESC